MKKKRVLLACVTLLFAAPLAACEGNPSCYADPYNAWWCPAPNPPGGGGGYGAR